MGKFSAVNLFFVFCRPYTARLTALLSFFARMWLVPSFEPFLLQEAEKIICKDVNSQFIVIELLAVLREKKIMRPGYTSLQAIVSQALNTERKRLRELIQQSLSETDKSCPFGERA